MLIALRLGSAIWVGEGGRSSDCSSESSTHLCHNSVCPVAEFYLKSLSTLQSFRSQGSAKAQVHMKNPASPGFIQSQQQCFCPFMSDIN